MRSRGGRGVVSTASLVLRLTARQQADRKESSKTRQSVVDETTNPWLGNMFHLKREKNNNTRITQG